MVCAEAVALSAVRIDATVNFMVAIRNEYAQKAVVGNAK